MNVAHVTQLVDTELLAIGPTAMAVIMAAAAITATVAKIQEIACTSDTAIIEATASTAVTVATASTGAITDGTTMMMTTNARHGVQAAEPGATAAITTASAAVTGTTVSVVALATRRRCRIWVQGGRTTARGVRGLAQLLLCTLAQAQLPGAWRGQSRRLARTTAPSTTSNGRTTGSATTTVHTPCRARTRQPLPPCAIAERSWPPAVLVHLEWGCHRPRTRRCPLAMLVPALHWTQSLMSSKYRC